jgi:hypothetical protein
MHRLRDVRFLTRLVLAWFALSLGVAMASPWVKPQALQLVCSAAGTAKLVPADGADDVAGASHLLDCPLCIMAAAPPPAARSAAAVPAGHAAPQARRSSWPGAVAALPPARGPPPAAS